MLSDRRLRAACRLTLDVVRAGLVAEPPVPAPHALHKVLGFQRLSSTAYETVARAVEDDVELRARVAGAADEESVGRAAWLWLHRPDGWATDGAWIGSGSVGEREASPLADEGARRSRSKGRAKAETEVARKRREADEARAGQRAARQELAHARRESADALAEVAELRTRLSSLTEERNQAVRTAKAAEADLAEARRRLKLAKEAAIDAEAELAALRAAGPAAAGADGDRSADVAPTSPAAAPSTSPSPAPSTSPSAPTVDAVAASAAVSAAATAATELGAALARAAQALEPRGDGRSPAAVEQQTAPSPRSVAQPRTKATGRGKARSRRPVHRAVAPLPPGIFDGTTEANRHLISAGDALLVVDGYNLARTTWTDLSPREDRQRVVSLLEAVQARSGGDVIVVFDGESGTVAPRHSSAIRVLFSATGVTADDHIVDLVASLPVERPVIVVSSDRAVMADATRHGATALTSPAFLTAASR